MPWTVVSVLRPFLCWIRMCIRLSWMPLSALLIASAKGSGFKREKENQATIRNQLMKFKLIDRPTPWINERFRMKTLTESLKVLKTTRRHTGKRKSTDGTKIGSKKRGKSEENAREREAVGSIESGRLWMNEETERQRLRRWAAKKEEKTKSERIRQNDFEIKKLGENEN